MNINSMSNLSQRLIVGGASTVIMLLAIWFSSNPYINPFFTLLIAAVVGTALWEFYAIPRALNYRPLRTLILVGSTAYIFAVYLSSTTTKVFDDLPMAIELLTMAAVFGYYFSRGSEVVTNSALSLLGFFYLTIPLSYLIKINNFHAETGINDGQLWLVYLLFTTKMTDVGAYIFGKNFGKIKITPYISPKKTLEGAIGGLIVASLTSLIIGTLIFPLFSKAPLSIATCLLVGALMGAVAQFGDLVESLLKRDGKIKDSNQIPGLGGVLDVVDSLIFTAPLLYLLLTNNQLHS